MAKNLLLEIGLEEMPAHVVWPSIKQLEEKVSKFLSENSLTFESIETFSTPRRLAIRVTNIPDRQEDVQEEVKGPAKKIALDAEGNWSKAAEGFVRGQGLTTDAITFRELNGVEYVYVTKYIHGKESKEVLTGLLDVVKNMNFPTMMHWGDTMFEYIRPIHWIVALLDEEVIPFELLDVTTGRTTEGHRFLGDQIELADPSEYEAKLEEQFVIADAHKRQQMIVEQIEEIAEKNKWVIELDPVLLEEVTNLVEYPTAFVGEFDERFLSIPEEVLVTSMKEHQRYFEVRNQAGMLLPHFISVRNGNSVKLDNVVKGNQKVLAARLEDGEFFFEEDKKLSIDDCVEKLKNVTFHEKIGSMYKKMQRVGLISQVIGGRVDLSEEELTDLKRASEIYKFDLVTNMVGEFPELQGIMGEKYALLKGEKPAVAAAIREHYLPNSSEGELPKTAVGAVLAIADKIDSVLGFFAVGMIPSGSNDPYALRRQTYGIVRIVEAQGWTFPFTDMQGAIVDAINEDVLDYGVHFNRDQKEFIEFFKGRMRQRLQMYNVRHDIIDAVLDSHQDDLVQVFKTAQIFDQHLSDEHFKEAMEALTRVINLTKKMDPTTINFKVDPKLFENDSEKELFAAVKEAEDEFANQSMAENYQTLTNLRPVIERYFNATMIMVDDEKVRDNRLNQLAIIARMANALASIDKIVTK
ncbi:MULTISPECIES: glycine--tRNA ligase subunit beta [Enterococcus]|uniref:Glycine--tRNA ligase beta subunit n=1 Tax=Enterococcus malodoratus ATCC 43197 TaxID=1158601 RepID=R2PCV1_9ENTE|nr:MULTISPECIES: glycine--tRNA ligase subunit beta [Enterococcus]EOH81088.1 glycine-tRNA ligase, beta subunit [Enterococcus malodoratus ATCC 43197]EOT69598.1 glycine-tRNA ligase, beta subunit [Enterococcus malodoratus ATCC 43197]OJG65329.1 glycine-tRNA ligase, beta subunit [Enterococcus malodoratus]SPX01239.1 glycyl-tRNA synthetase subunit beta [Enterococcus malodoratus]STC71048.1 glycyl-tRNA synthetase subunit beta [Enterococcus malodoratus]